MFLAKQHLIVAIFSHHPGVFLLACCQKFHGTLHLGENGIEIGVQHIVRYNFHRRIEKLIQGNEADVGILGNIVIIVVGDKIPIVGFDFCTNFLQSSVQLFSGEMPGGFEERMVQKIGNPFFSFGFPGCPILKKKMHRQNRIIGIMKQNNRESVFQYTAVDGAFPFLLHRLPGKVRGNVGLLSPVTFPEET